MVGFFAVTLSLSSRLLSLYLNSSYTPMDDENEVLDWEEDEEQTTGLVDDADGVSLGSESGDENPNAAPPASASSASIRASVLSSQDANGASRPISPKPSTPLQREGSHSSLKPNDTTPIASPNSQSRSHRSKSKPISSIQMIHGLPPKPVVSAVPPMPLSNSSLTEATAMATRESGKGKSGGGSKSTEISLPPNWEVRHSQSTKQVYYYNNRTHQSTWERPVSTFPPPSPLHTIQKATFTLMSSHHQTWSSSFTLSLSLLPVHCYIGV